MICCLLLITLSAKAYKERDLLGHAADKEKLKTMLITDRKWVAYPSYAEREKWDKLLGDNKIRLIEEAERYLDYEWKVVRATDYIEFTRSGNRSIMDGRHNANLLAISALFMGEMAEGKGRFTDQLANGIFHLCEMTTWSSSAHLSAQRVRGSFPKLDDQIIDLLVGDAGATFSWIYYFLNKEFDKITPLISERLYHEIDRRVLTPYLDETRFWWMATNVTADSGMVNNWNVWCNANVIQCFLLVEKDKERMADGVYKTMLSVDKFINYNHDDGACEEGPSYWEHAAGKLYDYLQVLYDATGGGISIFDEPMIRNMGEYIARSYAGNGWVVNFADASARTKLDYRLIYRYGDMVGSAEMKHFAAYLRKEHPAPLTTSRDAYRFLADLSSDEKIDAYKPLHLVTPFTWYADTEFCYMSEGDLFVAAKGGYNDESHNHNDVGTFSLYAGNEPVLIDVGVGTYSRQTFSSERYTIWTMQSDYHNVPNINACAQQYGKQYRAKVLKADKAKKTFSLDIAGAYPAEAGIKRWVRTYKLSKDKLCVEEHYDLSNARTANQLNFMTWGKVDIASPGMVTITVKGKTYQLIYDKDQFAPALQTIDPRDTRLSDVWGNEIVRISLKAKNIAAKGTYRIYIKD